MKSDRRINKNWEYIETVIVSCKTLEQLTVTVNWCEEVCNFFNYSKLIRDMEKYLRKRNKHNA